MKTTRSAPSSSSRTRSGNRSERRWCRRSARNGAPKLRVECGYINNTDRRIQYGLGGQEMCVFLAYTDADLVIGATSGANAPKGQDPQGIYRNETSCGIVLAVPAP